MASSYQIVEVMVFVAGLTSLITWVRIDSDSRRGVNTRLWTVAALFLPAAIYYVFAVRPRYPRSEPPTTFEYLAGSVAVGSLGWTMVELYFPTYFPRNARGALLTAVVVASLSTIVYVGLTTYRREALA